MKNFEGGRRLLAFVEASRVVVSLIEWLTQGARLLNKILCADEDMPRERARDEPVGQVLGEVKASCISSTINLSFSSRSGIIWQFLAALPRLETERFEKFAAFLAQAHEDGAHQTAHDATDGMHDAATLAAQHAHHFLV